ncbi:hypothetical protein LUZ61_006442 [Rhynchospora tenuis]|uniref:Leucine-rich repeat-containing N-terminal plant-type domain-containing protein n=1 Tax=Rhynchospora tenuis TaxID=198213 RepID=A0AAD5ZRH4_9POAL|nr:hypothetical protein LUZ61_006442 [Rhynchospora tenuis]
MNNVLVFLFSLLIIQSSRILAKECHKEERDALLSFKAGISDPSNLLSSWHGDDCCNWWGVLCDNSTGYVVHLDLGNQYNSYWSVELSNSISSPYAFTGEINQSLLGLKHLTYIDLSLNDFSTTTIPEFIGSFENLQYLNLSYSSFTGEIPPQLGNLSKLFYLDLSNSKFTGKIPPELGNISNLIFLNLGRSYGSDVEDHVVSFILFSLKQCNNYAT